MLYILDELRLWHVPVHVRASTTRVTEASAASTRQPCERLLEECLEAVPRIPDGVFVAALDRMLYLVEQLAAQRQHVIKHRCQMLPLSPASNGGLIGRVHNQVLAAKRQ